MKKKLSQKLKRQLEQARVVQKNQVFISGLETDGFAQQELKNEGFLGQFGKVKKLILNKKIQQIGNLNKPINQLYVTYDNSSQAALSILSLKTQIKDIPNLKVNYGMSKFCQFFLDGKKCSNVNCMYLHELVDQELLIQKQSATNSYFQLEVESLTKEIMQKMSLETIRKQLDTLQKIKGKELGLKNVIQILEEKQIKDQQIKKEIPDKKPQITTWNSEEEELNISEVKEETHGLKWEEEKIDLEKTRSSDQKESLKKSLVAPSDGEEETFLSQHICSESKMEWEKNVYLETLQQLIEQSSQRTKLEKFILSKINKNLKLRRVSRFKFPVNEHQ